MPFRCPQCLTLDSLQILQSIELLPDRHCDEISLQVVECSACSFRGLAVYEEFIRGAETDAWNHTGYWVSPDAVNAVLEAMRSCPDPHNTRCGCEAHLSLGKKDVDGIWRGLLEMKNSHTFSMRLWNESVE